MQRDFLYFIGWGVIRELSVKGLNNKSSADENIRFMLWHVRHVQGSAGQNCTAPQRHASGRRDHRPTRWAPNHSSLQMFCFHRSKALLSGCYVGPPSPIRDVWFLSEHFNESSVGSTTEVMIDSINFRGAFYEAFCS